MSVECTNPNLKTAQTAQLEQPAPKQKLDLYIPQTQQSKIKNSFVIRRQKGINGELREKKVGCSSSIPSIVLIRMTRSLMAVKTLNAKVIHHSIMNHILLNHFSEKQPWKTLFHFQFGLLFLTFCCYELGFRRRRRGADDQHIKTKKVLSNFQVKMKS